MFLKKRYLLFFLKKVLLLPFSLIWEGLYKLRRALYTANILKSEYFQIPIISVGNVTFGGTGKTPFIAWLSNYFVEKGLNPLVLTRGYKGKLEHGVGIIVKGQRFKTNPVEYGDEPLLLSRKMKDGAVIVGKKRAENLRNSMHDLKPDVVLLDDGLQHLKLYRSLNVVLFDATLPLDRYRVAPLGYLREGMSALKDADAVVISRSDQVPSSKLEELKDLVKSYLAPEVPFAHIKYEPQGVFNFADEEVFSLQELKGKKVIAVTAIASPHSFVKTLKSLQAEVVEEHHFNDHHFFAAQEISDLLDRAEELSAMIMTSEKDMVKIKKVMTDKRICYLSIDVVFTRGKAELLQKIHPLLKEEELR